MKTLYRHKHSFLDLPDDFQVLMYVYLMTCTILFNLTDKLVFFLLFFLKKI